MNNKDLEQAIQEIQSLSYQAAKYKHIADGWPNSSYGDENQKFYESVVRQMKEIHNRWRQVAKLAERYGDLPSELLFNLYAYDTTEARHKDLQLRRAEMLELGIYESEEPIRNLDEEIRKAFDFLRELKPKTNKCLKMVEYLGLEWYHAFIKHSGALWVGRDTQMRLIPFNEASNGEFYEPDYSSMSYHRDNADSPFYAGPIKKITRQFIRYAFGNAQRAICLKQPENEVLVLDWKREFERR